MDVDVLPMLKGMRVLYVEDDLATREELAMMVAPWVGQLDVAGDGKAGLSLYTRERHDIVVTDIQMPVMSGLAMAGDIRHLDPQQPIVVLSAYNDIEFLFRAIELGITQYITKPVNVERLLARLGDIAQAILALREQSRNRRLLEQYRLLADESAVVTTLNQNGVITYVNDRLAHLTGYERQELLGTDWARLSLADEPRARIESIWQSVQTGKKWAGVVKSRTRRGELLVVERSLVPIVNEQGRVEEVFSLDVDITELYASNEVLIDELSQSEHSLQVQRDYLSAYKRALETGTSICVADDQGRILSANPQFAEILGYRVRDLCGLELRTVVPQYDGKRCDATELAQEPREGRIMSVLHRNGKELYFNIVFVPMEMRDGQSASVILVCQDLTESLELTREVMDTQRDLLMLVGEIVENRSLETGMHVKRVGEISRLLAIQCGLDSAHADILRVAAPLHDVGKVGIPDVILHKPGRLDSSEFEVMKTHAAMGYQILRQINRPLVRMAALVAHEHHERYDGQGYPRGIRGDEISIEGRIVAIADVLDALGNTRSYKAPWEDAAIRAYLQKHRGRRFDPMLVDLVFANWDDILAIRSRYTDV